MPIEIEPYIENIFRFALSLCGDRHLAEDLTQDCLLKAHQRFGQLRDRSRVKSWLLQILHNLWKDHLKKKQIDVEDVEQSTLASSQFSPFNLSVQQDEHKKMLDLMQSLPEQQRTVLFLRAVEEMTIEEIATTTHKSKNAVKANLSIARKTMRKRLLESEERATRRNS